MITTIQKWGNSLGLRIPKTIAETISITEGTDVTIEVIGASLILTKKTNAVKEAQVAYAGDLRLREQIHLILKNHFHGHVAEMTDWLHQTYEMDFQKADYSGILKWPENPLSYQRRLRDDWE